MIPRFTVTSQKITIHLEHINDDCRVEIIMPGGPRGVAAMSKMVLNDVPPGAKIIIQLPDGRQVVHVKETKEQIIKRKYGKLMGQPITVTEAAEKYNVHRDTVIEWKKNGYITVLKPGYRMELDEADLAYCAGIYHERKLSGIGFRAPLLDADGLPYRLKHPKLARYRRKKRETA